jgi:hypothetical protein
MVVLATFPEPKVTNTKSLLFLARAQGGFYMALPPPEIQEIIKYVFME